MVAECLNVVGGLTQDMVRDLVMDEAAPTMVQLTPRLSVGLIEKSLPFRTLVRKDLPVGSHSSMMSWSRFQIYHQNS